MSQARPARPALIGTRSIRARVRRSLGFAALGFWAVICLFPLYSVAATSIKPSLDVIDGPQLSAVRRFPPEPRILGPQDGCLRDTLRGAAAALAAAAPYDADRSRG